MLMSWRGHFLQTPSIDCLNCKLGHTHCFSFFFLSNYHTLHCSLLCFLWLDCWLYSFDHRNATQTVTRNWPSVLQILIIRQSWKDGSMLLLIEQIVAQLPLHWLSVLVCVPYSQSNLWKHLVSFTRTAAVDLLFALNWRVIEWHNHYLSSWRHRWLQLKQQLSFFFPLAWWRPLGFTWATVSLTVGRLYFYYFKVCDNATSISKREAVQEPSTR